MGYGIAGGSEKISVNSGSVTSQELLFDGGAFVTDINLNANINFGPASGGLLLGYRIANVSEMKASTDNADAGFKKGDLMKGPDGKALVFDYSGLVVGLNFSIGF